MKRNKAISSDSDSASDNSQPTSVQSPSLPETLLRVDLWTSQGPAASTQALAMVTDLLAADHGELRDSPAGSLLASFPDPAQAVNAARHLQRLILGFSRASSSGPLNAAYTLTSTAEPDFGAPPQAHPGQLLFVGGICESASTIPGLQFSTLTTAAWDTAPGTVLQLLPPVFMDGYTDEPVSPGPLLEVTRPPATRPGQSTSTVQSPPIPVARSVIKVPIAPSPSTIPLPTPVPVTTFNPRWAIISVVTVALVGTILVFSPILKSSSHPTTPPPTQSATPTQTPPPAKPQAATKSLITPASKPKDSAARNNSSAPPLAVPEEPKPEVAPRPNQHGLTFSSAEIESLLARADKHAGDGDYDRAILEYRTVLNQEPSNALARKGLARAQYNKEHR